MTPKGFAEMSLHQDKIDDASLLECHCCEALVIIGWDNKRCLISICPPTLLAKRNARQIESG